MRRGHGPASVAGVFAFFLGAGLILDGDWTWRGGLLMAGGAALLAAALLGTRRA